MKYMMIALTILCFIWGCGVENDMASSPADQEATDQPETLALLSLSTETSDTSTVPSWYGQDILYDESEIGAEGGMLRTADGTKFRILNGALTTDTLVSMTVICGENRVDFTFAPHGTTFAKPATLELSWKLLGDVTQHDLILYYWDEDANEGEGAWLEYTQAVWNNSEKKATLNIDHFSQYYYYRR